jgi:hypothetical protein
MMGSRHLFVDLGTLVFCLGLVLLGGSLPKRLPVWPAIVLGIAGMVLVIAGA